MSNPLPLPLPIVTNVADLRTQVSRWRREFRRVALVPTMGALHDGHLALIAAARRQADRVIASIFVNPTQFGPNEDFDRYPRDQARDAAMLAGAGCDLLYAPGVATMYPAGFATTVSAGALANRLCGAARPGHFDGVATVVTKLLLQATPDVALFGEKDWQQLCIIKRVTADLDLQTEIAGVPIVRDPDGLALSSRNAYLSAGERERAVALPLALHQANAALLAGGDVAVVLAAARSSLTTSGFARVDYVELVHPSDLAPISQMTGSARLLAAAWMGSTRLIDNVDLAGR